MSSISCNRSSCFSFGALRTLVNAPPVSFANAVKAFKLFAVASTAVMLAACAGPSLAPGRQASLESRQASLGSNRHVAFIVKEHPSLTKEQAKGEHIGLGLVARPICFAR